MNSSLKYDGQIPTNNLIQRLKIISINPSIVLMLHSVNAAMLVKYSYLLNNYDDDQAFFQKK